MNRSTRQRLLLNVVLLAWASWSFGCGGDGDRTSEGQGPRLEWDQQADSLKQAQSLSFRLYVDDAGRTLNGAACREAAGRAGYVCSAPLPQFEPGRHVLQLASVLNGVESSRSGPLVVSGDIGQITVPQQPDVAAPGLSSAACLTGSATECYAVRTVATGLSGVTALSPLPDGRLLFVEGDTAVRVVADGALVGEPALTLNIFRARVVGLAIDRRSFLQTRFVFVAWIEQMQSDQAQLNVTRYREVGNALGEGATILTGIPVPRESRPSLAADHDEHIYVAVPALNTRSSPNGAGVVLRITRDGLVPPDNRLGLPAFTSGFSAPTSLSIELGQQNIWLAGRNSSSPYVIGVVPASPSEQPPSPHVVARVASDEPVSFVLSEERPSEQPVLFVLANGQLSKALRQQDGGIAAYAPLNLGDLRLTAVAAEGLVLYVATSNSIYELTRQ